MWNGGLIKAVLGNDLIDAPLQPCVRRTPLSHSSEFTTELLYVESMHGVASSHPQSNCTSSSGPRYARNHEIERLAQIRLLVVKKAVLLLNVPHRIGHSMGNNWCSFFCPSRACKQKANVFSSNCPFLQPYHLR